MPEVHAVIIEDDAFNIEVLSRLLESRGVSVTAVNDARDTEQVIQQLSNIDVIFLDLEMPNLNGYEIFAMLQEILDPAIPIVACTVHINEIQNAQDMGFHSFIAKPLDNQRFPEQLDMILNNVQVWEI